MVGAFTDQAHNLILLAGDEARMLGRLVVEPEHLLLALTRHGTVRSLLGERGVTGSDVYATIVRRSSVGDDLAVGVVPRSRATDWVLERAVEVAARRGVLGPSSEHLLLALAADPQLEAAAILVELEIDAVTLVDGMPGERREPVSPEQLTQWLLRVAGRCTAPQPGPVAPAYERYTAEAQRAVRAASEIASLLEHRDVGPLQATGIFMPEARQIVAQGALGYAYRHDDPWIGTGHLLLATLGTIARSTASWAAASWARGRSTTASPEL